MGHVRFIKVIMGTVDYLLSRSCERITNASRQLVANINNATLSFIQNNVIYIVYYILYPKNTLKTIKIIYIFCIYLIMNIHSTCCQSLVTVSSNRLLVSHFEMVHKYQVERAGSNLASLNTHVFLRLEDYDSVRFYCRTFKQKSFESSFARLSSNCGRFLKIFLVWTLASKEYVFFYIFKKFYLKKIKNRKSGIVRYSQ